MTHPLVVNNVVRKFSGNTALDGASFALKRGEFLGLLGPNGAGKTTLIRMISGRLRADSGTISVYGIEQRSGGNPEIMPRLGIIPQNIAIYDNLTARENLQLFGTLDDCNPDHVGRWRQYDAPLHYAIVRAETLFSGI